MYDSGYELALQIITCFALVLQVYIVYLVETRSVRNMTEYRYFLKMFLFWDLLFTLILGLFLQPRPVLPFIACVCSGLVKYFGQHACMVMISAAIYSGTNVIMCQGYCLLYRFSVIHDNADIHFLFMTKWAKFGYILFSQSVSLFLAIFYYNTFIPIEKLPQFIAPFKELIAQQQISIDSFEQLVFVDSSSSLIKSFLALLVFLSFSSEILALTLICLILLMLQKNSKKYSKQTFKLHVQLTIVLLAQLLTPILLVIGPVVCFSVYFLYGQMPCALWIEIGVLMITLYGPINSALVLVFVGPYRRHFLDSTLFSWLRPLLQLIGLDGCLPKRVNFRGRQSSLTPTAQHYLRRQSRVFSISYVRPI